MFPPRRGDDEPRTTAAGEGARIVMLHPPQKSCFDLYPLVFFDRQHERRFWCVEPTGDYGTDCEAGRALGLAFLQSCDRTHGWCALLGWIVADMISAGKPATVHQSNGLIVGFMSVLSTAIAAGASIVTDMEGA